MLYGFFPIFSRYVTSDQIIEALEILNDAKPEIWQDILFSIPNEWQLSDEARDAIDRFLLERARFLVDNLEQIVSEYLNQPHL